ncbi:hypothetical protein [Methylorubrum extorquens]
MTARLVSRDEAISLGRIDPAASAYGAHLRRKGILRPMPEPVALLDTTPSRRSQRRTGRGHSRRSHEVPAVKYIALLCRLLAPASEPSADAPRLIRAGRVLSDGCGR